MGNHKKSSSSVLANIQFPISIEDKLEIWTTYIQELFYGQNPIKQCLCIASTRYPIRGWEVARVLKKMKDGNAVGFEEVWIEVLKPLIGYNLDVMVSLFNKIQETERIPSNWLRSTCLTSLKQPNVNITEPLVKWHTVKLFLKIIHKWISGRKN